MPKLNVEDLAKTYRIPSKLVQAAARALTGARPAVVGSEPLTSLQVQSLWRLWPRDHKRALNPFCRVLGPRPSQGHVYCAPAHKVPDTDNTRPGRRVSGGKPGRSWTLLHPAPWSAARQDLQLWAVKDLLRLADTLPEEVQAEARAAVYGACLYGAFEARGEDFALYGYDSAEALRAAFSRADAQVESFLVRITQTRSQEGGLLRRKRFQSFAGSYLEQDEGSNSRAVLALARKLGRQSK